MTSQTIGRAKVVIVDDERAVARASADLLVERLDRALDQEVG